MMTTCERCKDTGEDPENESVESYGDVERRLPEPCSDCQLQDKPVERGELWSLIDWTLWGSGMGDVFREPLADTFIRALTPEQVQQAENLMQAWHDSGREPLGRRRYEELKTELDEARQMAAEARRRKPRRGDVVEQWLRAQRDDNRDTEGGAWTLLDNLLDRYQLHADTGTPLNEHACEGQTIGDCDCMEASTASSPSGNSRIKQSQAENPPLGHRRIEISDLLGFLSTSVEPELPRSELEQQRDALIEIMRGVSEQRWSAEWMGGLERILHHEGGIWEHIGRETGWPTGEFENWTWVTWNEAAKIFADKNYCS